MAIPLPKTPTRGLPARPAVGPSVDVAPPGGTGLREALVERLGLRALTYPVPAHANALSYTLGGITLIGFVLLIVTGIYLAQFYHPHPSDAHNSVIYIMTSAPFGDVVRGVHYWSAMAVTVTVMLHMLRVFVTGAYKAPREANWLVGLGLLAVTVGFVFTGTVVKWDQEGIEALAHNQGAASLLGGIGSWFSNDFSLAVPVMVRVFIAHIAILPSLLTLLIVYHIFLIKVHGMAPEGVADGRETDPSIDRADKVAVYGEKMHPFSSHIAKIAGWGMLLTAVVTILALVPFVDRGRNRSLRTRKAILVAGAIFIVLVVALTLFTALTPVVAHTQM